MAGAQKQMPRGGGSLNWRAAFWTGCQLWTTSQRAVTATVAKPVVGLGAVAYQEPLKAAACVRLLWQRCLAAGDDDRASRPRAVRPGGSQHPPAHRPQDGMEFI